MAYTVTIGAIRCHILSDGKSLADGGGFFGLIPRSLWQDVIAPNAQNMIPWDTRSLLIESDAGLILVDVGNGDKLPAKVRRRQGMDDRIFRLIGELARLGVAPEDVTTVLLTHFHGDHAGGATRYAEPADPQSPIVAAFPNATYVGQRLDLADASFPNERTAATYLAGNFQPLLDGGRLRVVDGPQRLAGGVRTDLAPGHTAAIQSVWVESQGEALLFLTDAASWAVHFERLAWVPAYDIFPLQSMETKRRLRQEALEKQALLVFQHDAQVVTGRLANGERGIHVHKELTEAADFDASR